MSNLSFEYAKALYDLSGDLKSKKDILSSLTMSKEIFDDEVLSFFLHPNIKVEDKKKVIGKTFPKGIYRDFLYVLLDNSRIDILEDIKIDYEKLLDDELKHSKVLVYSKERLSDKYLEKLQDKLENMLNKNITLDNILDESIIGGIRIEYDFKVLDLSINKRIDDMVKTLKE